LERLNCLAGIQRKRNNNACVQGETQHWWCSRRGVEVKEVSKWKRCQSEGSVKWAVLRVNTRSIEPFLHGPIEPLCFLNHLETYFKHTLSRKHYSLMVGLQTEKANIFLSVS
jgi:hypothetical protein